MTEEIRQELRKFGESTSIKGVSRTIRTHSRVVRIFWLVALLACFSVLLWQVTNLAIDFFSYGVTNTFLLAPSQPNFPDVTICNFNPIADDDQFYELHDKFLQKVKILQDQAPDKLKSSNRLWNMCRLLYTFNANIPFLEDPQNKSNVNNLIVSSRFYEWDFYNRMVDDEVPVLGKPLQFCTTLTSGSKAAAVSSIIFINDLMPKLVDSYYDNIRINLGTGVKVMIHPKGTKPDHSVAVYVAPGTSITINLNQNNITRLPYPYGDCSDRQRIYMEDENSLAYDRTTCISLCRQRQRIKACGCLDNLEYFTDVELQMGNYTFCANITKHMEDSQMYSEQGILTEIFWSLLSCFLNFLPIDDKCDCPIPCSETQYEISSSSSQWPNIHYQLAFYNDYIRNDDRYRQTFPAYENIRKGSDGQSDAEIIEELQKLKLIEQNFLQVTVRMSQKMVELVKDIPALTWNTVSSNLGGSLNLWLGISIMTAAEIIELIYSLAKIALGLYRKRIDTQNTHL